MDGVEFLAEGIMISKAISSSFNILKANLPAEWTARNFAQKFNYFSTNLTCADFFANCTTISSAKKLAACAALPMDVLDNMRLWVNGTWYSNYDYIMPASGLNADDLNEFYNEAVVGGFKPYLDQVVID